MLASFAAVVVTVPVGFIFEMKFRNKLAYDHIDVWRDLGRPGLGLLGDDRSLRTFMYRGVRRRFVLKREYRDLGDNELTRLGDTLRKCYLILYFALIVGFISIVVGGVSDVAAKRALQPTPQSRRENEGPQHLFVPGFTAELSVGPGGTIARGPILESHDVI